MKIDSQKFMLRQLKKEYENSIVAIRSGIVPVYTPFNFEEWLTEQDLTEDE